MLIIEEMQELKIDVKEVKKLKNIFFLDVRTKEEYEEMKIENSKLIPLNELESRINEIPKDKQIIVYCHKGIRSFQAALFLKQKGFNVKSIDGGIDAWLKNSVKWKYFKIIEKF